MSQPFLLSLTGGGFTESTSSFLLIVSHFLGPVRSEKVMQAARHWSEGGGWCSEAVEGVLELSGGVVVWATGM